MSLYGSNENPARLFSKILLLVFSAEALVMFLLPIILPNAGAFVSGLVDGTALTVFVAPFLWLLVVKPLRSIASDEKLRAEKIVSQSLDGIVTTSEDGVIESLNPAAEMIFGFKVDELIGLKIERIIPTFSPTVSLKTFIRRTEMEITGKRKDDSKFDLELVLDKITIKGRPAYMLFCRDITARKLAELNQDVQFAITRILSESDSTDSASPRLISAICEGMGWEIGELWCVEQNSDSLRLCSVWHKPEIDAAGFVAEFMAMTRSMSFKRGEGVPGTVWARESPMWIPDVSVNPLYIRREVAAKMGLHAAFGFPTQAGGHANGIMLFYSNEVRKSDYGIRKIMTDIGRQIGQFLARKQAEQQVIEQQAKAAAGSKMAALGEMAGGVAHEINNPLAIIQTLSGQLHELLQDEPVDTNMAAELSKKIESTTVRIAKIVNGLRSFSRDGSKDLFEHARLENIINDTLAFCGERFKHRGVTLTIDAGSIDVSIECRSTQISQVLLNLLNNSLDAVQGLPEKWVKLSVQDMGEKIEISIADSGSGISAEVIGKIFQPFFTTKDIGKGTGLGLSVSKGIVESHNGIMCVDTDSPNTKFVISLPKRQAATQERATS